MAHESVHTGTSIPEAAPTPRVAVETNGINVIAESERKGTPSWSTTRPGGRW